MKSRNETPLSTSPQLGAGANRGQGEKKLPFTEPKLTFVEPKLVKHGDVADVTAGFFGTFSP